MSDSYRLEASSPEAVPCERCGHRADSHLHPGSCSVRGHWWRHCRCTGYIRSESADYSAGAAPPVDRRIAFLSTQALH